MTACTFSACDNFECMKNFVDDLVVTCDEVADTPESVLINPIFCLELLVAIVLK